MQTTKADSLVIVEREEGGGEIEREKGGIPRSFIHFAKQRLPLSRSGFPIEKHLETISRESIEVQRNSRNTRKDGRADCKWRESTKKHFCKFMGSRGGDLAGLVELGIWVEVVCWKSFRSKSRFCVIPCLES